MGERISVLAVEDETLIRFNVVDELEDAGYKVFDAANADAIAILTVTPAFDCFSRTSTCQEAWTA